MTLNPAYVLRIVSETAWAEASGEGLEGMSAVLSTLGKRVSYNGWMGTDLVSVCLCKDKHGVHQYSCWNAHDPNITRINAVNANDPALQIAISLSRQLIAGTLADTTNGADSYYRIGTAEPSWATPGRYRKTIGHHMFYLLGLDGKQAQREPLTPVAPIVPTPATPVPEVTIT